ncbi:DprA-like winged helix domain-containing protein [Ideonella livida]|uniref:DprA winged helix domain-containing protein n=1 Tax=Ideonella livida TaxID=2707176 RepID=A0A7C9PHU1_9BURK|nr:hypothetical protein [Ideonella livida]NDY91414.1 hypothetical protein [Ideonella livida]
MKSYKLTAWPELPSSFRRVSYTRLLTELSQRHVTATQLHQSTGVSASDIRALLLQLEQDGLLDVRHLPDAPARWSWRDLSLNQWLRRV